MAGTMAELARRIGFPLRFAARRVTTAWRPMSVAAFGVALAACALAVAVPARAIGENRAVADAVDQLPANARDVEVSWVGVGSSPSEQPDELDRQARAALSAVGLTPRARTLAYRDARLDGQVVRLAAADDLSKWLVVERGRLPRRCSPARCETVLVGRGAAPRISGLPVVGVAEPRPGTPARRGLGGGGRGRRPAPRVRIGVPQLHVVRAARLGAADRLDARRLRAESHARPNPAP